MTFLRCPHDKKCFMDRAYCSWHFGCTATFTSRVQYAYSTTMLVNSDPGVCVVCLWVYECCCFLFTVYLWAAQSIIIISSTAAAAAASNAVKTCCSSLLAAVHCITWTFRPDSRPQYCCLVSLLCFFILLNILEFLSPANCTGCVLWVFCLACHNNLFRHKSLHFCNVCLYWPNWFALFWAFSFQSQLSYLI